MVSRMMLSSPVNGEASDAFTRQPASYALRLEEMQSTMNEPRKSFESMNMEEIMKNMWVAEDSKVGIAALASSDNGLNGQNSLSLPPLLSSKTVDDVWRDIQRQSAADVAGKQQEHPHPHPHAHGHPHERRATLGEMTLEDFLVRTGVVREDPDAGSHTAENNNFYPAISTASASNGFSQSMDVLAPGMQAEWMNYPPHHQHQQLLQQAEAIAAAKRGFQPPSLMLPAGSPMYDGLTDSVVLGPDRFASSLALSPAFSDYSSHNRKRFTSEVAVEKTMERRQKRMIKNRESAARSRARKQAYTVELEAEVTLLKEENARLKQQQVSQSRLPEAMCVQNSKMRVLRRTQSY